MCSCSRSAWYLESHPPQKYDRQNARSLCGGIRPTWQQYEEGRDCLQSHNSSGRRYGQSKKDIFPRVYKADGSYHYSKDYDNILRKKGKFYVENWKITGSKEEENGKKRFALIKWVKEAFMEDLRRFCHELEAEIGKCIHVRGQ